LWCSRSLLALLSGIILSSRAITIRDMYAGYWASNAPHVKLFIDPSDEDLLPIVAHMSAVADVEPRHVVQARLKTRDGQWVTLGLTVLQDCDDSRISVVQSEAGACRLGDARSSWSVRRLSC
jgi:hypothetical protein